jgi:hypothetical protein
LVFVLAVFATNVAYQFLLSCLFDELMRLTRHADAIPWLGGIVTFPWQLRIFALEFLPLILSVIAAIAVCWPADAPIWRRAITLISAVIVPYVALFSFIVFGVWMCLHEGQKGCLP